MKKALSILLVMCVLCLFIPATAEVDLTGDWYFVRFLSDEPIWIDMTIVAKITLSLYNNGTFAIVVNTQDGVQKADGSWKYTENGIIVTIGDESELFVYEDSLLWNVDENGSTLVFSRNKEAVAVLDVTLNKKNVVLTRTSKKKKPSVVLKASVQPADATIKGVKWSSSDPTVAKVNDAGKVIGLKAGTAVITCTSKDIGVIAAECQITVKDKQIQKLYLNKTKANVLKGDTLQLKVRKVKPADALNQKVKWSSSNKKVATVSKNGKIKALKKGSCYIICTAADGSGVKVKCKITVK